ncbi:hypothetical protein B0H16DRAFT_1469283 [Mycena metata]|uniref:Uncharacterized protein n=1 Tax=Mycena metata TaxID=1033252 RepID=A0AAD7HY43_9AGAR|nr:hypothetical protein B0H16DRAFT_1469283 [Mycena metata]
MHEGRHGELAVSGGGGIDHGDEILDAVTEADAGDNISAAILKGLCFGRVEATSEYSLFPYGEILPYWVCHLAGCYQDPGLSPKRPDPNPDKFWKEIAFGLCQIPTFSTQMRPRPVSKSRQNRGRAENFEISDSPVSIPTNPLKIGLLGNKPGSFAIENGQTLLGALAEGPRFNLDPPNSVRVTCTWLEGTTLFQYAADIAGELGATPFS